LKPQVHNEVLRIVALLGMDPCPLAGNGSLTFFIIHFGLMVLLDMLINTWAKIISTLIGQ
jgi:hydrogenase maturation factor